MTIDPRSSSFRAAVRAFEETGERKPLNARAIRPVAVDDPEAWRWYAVTVQAGSELALGVGLRKSGFAVWSPCKKVKAKKTRRHTSKSILDVPVFRGFILVGEGEGYVPDWRRLFRRRMVWSVVGIGGQPAPLPYHQIDRAIRKECGAVAGGVHFAPPGGLKSVRVGDTVEVCGTALDETRSKVSFVGVEHGVAIAKIRAMFFGSEKFVNVPIDNLRVVGV